MSTVDLPAAGRDRRARKLPRWLKPLFGLLAVLGPGLISANAGNDAGGIITYASAGSQFGYRTLFLMVLSRSRWSSCRRCAHAWGPIPAKGWVP